MRPIYILLALAIYTPFEDDFLCMLHLSPTLLDVAKTIPELIIYATLAAIVAIKQFRHERIAVTGVEALVAISVISALATTYVYGGNMVNAAINLKALFRYLCATLIAINSEFTKRDLELLIRVIVIGAIFQALLSILCVVVPPLGMGFHLLRQANGIIDDKVGSEFGTFSFAASGSLYYLIALAFVMSKAYKSKLPQPAIIRWIIMGLLMIGIALTMKRAALLAAAIGYMTLLVIDKKRVRAGVLAIGGAIVAGGMILLAQAIGTTTINATEIRTTQVDVMDFATELFTSDYWQKSSQDSRGWILTDIFPNLIMSVRVTGFGADPDEAKHLFVEDNPGLTRFIDYTALEDVYWAAVLLYYGTLGAALLLWILLRFAMRIWIGRRYLDSVFEKEISTTVIMLILISIMYAFVVRVFELRAFSYYFWLFVGVAVQQYRSAKRAKLAAMAPALPQPVRPHPLLVAGPGLAGAAGNPAT